MDEPPAQTIQESGLLRLSDQAWQEAKRRAAVIAPLAAQPVVPVFVADEAAATLGLSQRSVYALICRYRASGGLLASLVPAPSPGGRGKGRLPAAAERIITTTLAERYLTRQKLKAEDVVDDIRRGCLAAGLCPPSRNTVRARIRRLRADEVVRRREGREAARRLTPVSAAFPPVVAPLQIYQMDHTEVDLIVVDEQSRCPIGRPYLTVAIDLYSRCIAGFYLSLEAPSATSVGLCLTHAVLDKEDTLTRLGIEDEWPIWGKPAAIHVDNGPEFHSEALRRGCAQHGIRIDYRPPGAPHFGGVIERVIGTLMQRVHTLPGTTFSNIQARGTYDAEGRAVLTLRELEQWLTLAIVGVYHREIHSTLGEPPLARLRAGFEAWGRLLPPRLQNPKAFLLDFLPIVRRTVQRHGFVVDHIVYYSHALRPWIAERDRGHRFVIRRDPRDLSRIWALCPEEDYYLEVPYRALAYPAITLWEHRQALARLRTEGRAKVDEAAIFRTVEAMRAIADQASIKSRAARRRQAGTDHLHLLPSAGSAPELQPSCEETPPPPVRPFDDIEEWDP